MAGNDGFARSVVKSLLTRQRPERETDVAAAAVAVTSVAAATSVGDGKGLQSGIGEERQREREASSGRTDGGVEVCNVMGKTGQLNADFPLFFLCLSPVRRGQSQFDDADQKEMSEWTFDGITLRVGRLPST